VTLTASTSTHGRRGANTYRRFSAWASPRRLYYLHRVDPEVPIEEIGAMASSSRPARSATWASRSHAQLERAVGVHPIAAVQTEWSLTWRGRGRGAADRGRSVATVPLQPPAAAR
jgi:aryl-alcohol dehydrogenase-like predicted oxidoreductase